MDSPSKARAPDTMRAPGRQSGKEIMLADELTAEAVAKHPQVSKSKLKERKKCSIYTSMNVRRPG